MSHGDAQNVVRAFQGVENEHFEQLFKAKAE